MSTTVFRDISAALDARLSAMPSLPPVAWENASFEPVSGTLYIRPIIIPASTAQAGLGTSGIDEHIGIYQVDVFAPSNAGKKAAMDQSDAIANQFKRGTDLVYNGVTVRLGNVSRAASLVDGDRYIITLSINYTAHVAPR